MKDKESKIEEIESYLCVCDSEQRERGVGAGVNATMLSETP